jgi:amino acid transporter
MGERRHEHEAGSIRPLEPSQRDDSRPMGRKRGTRDHAAPSPSEMTITLDDRQLGVLRRVGHEWGRVCADPEVWRRALPVDPNAVNFPDPADVQPARFGRFVRVSTPNGPRGQQAEVEATGETATPPSLWGRVGYNLRRVVLGTSLRSTAIAQERMRKLMALPVLSADALSSVAYGPEAMLAILVIGGGAGLAYSLPIAATIAFLMLAVGVSYRQTIRAYPHVGGSYIVASDNLGRLPGLVAAAGLITDYILTVAVSVAAGVAAISSAVPSLAHHAVPIGVGVIALLLAGNLRGVRQAGVLFAAPTYAFIVAIFALVAANLYQAAGRGFHPIPTPPVTATETVGVLLVLRAFASGSTAMTGIEAISNAVPAFEPIEWRNARTTLTWMIGLLMALFAAMITMVTLAGIVPNPHETVLSQLAHRGFGSGWLYWFTQAATAAILLLGANTAYNDFPRVLFLLARDFHAPRIFLRMGDRLAFSNGIILLSVAATAIYAAFGGQTEPLIPLFAIGVFLAFTMSQAGMVVHWWRHRDAHWRKSLVFNATGCALSAIVFLTAGVTKFTAGAWVAVLAIALFLFVALRIRRHYDAVGRAIALHPHAVEIPHQIFAPSLAKRRAQPARDARGRWTPVRNDEQAQRETEDTPEEIQHLTVVPVVSLDLASMRALAYAASLQQPVLGLHVSPVQAEAERFRDYWDIWGDHVPLEVVLSPYRAIVAPLIHYIESLHRQHPEVTLTVILPEIIVRHWWHRLLHNHTAPRLRRALRRLPKIIITTVPFHVTS